MRECERHLLLLTLRTYDHQQRWNFVTVYFFFIDFHHDINENTGLFAMLDRTINCIQDTC